MVIQSTAKKKLVTFIKKNHPEVKDEKLPLLLKDIRRFVTVVQKIYTEPQAKIYFKDIKEGERKVKKRFIDTNIEELLKIKRAPREPITVKTIRELTQKVTKTKVKEYGR